MDKATIILEILKSLNNGKCGYNEDRVEIAIMQYNQLVENNIIKDEEDD